MTRPEGPRDHRGTHDGEVTPGPSPAIVLASQSPRRADLLRMLGFTFDVDPAAVPEERLADETPDEHVLRLAEEKARAVAARRPEALVIAGDTVVVRDMDILGKPTDEADAVAMLMSLQGRSHVVASALALAGPSVPVRSDVSRTRVRFRAFTSDEAREYVATGEPLDKAGAYGIQGLGAVFVDSVEGDFFTVMGLPLPLLVRMLAEIGAPYRFRRERQGSRPHTDGGERRLGVPVSDAPSPFRGGATP